MKCISVQDFLYTTYFPTTRLVFRFRFSEEVCHISQQTASDLTHAVIASDGKVYDAWMLQKWFWYQFDKEVSDFFVIPDMPIHLIYISEPTDIIIQFFNKENLRYVANSIYSSQFVASFLYLVKYVAFLCLSLKPKLILLFRFLCSLSSLSGQSNCLRYRSTKITNDVGIQCEFGNTKKNVHNAPFSMRKNKPFQIPSVKSAFYRISPASK